MSRRASAVVLVGWICSLGTASVRAEDPRFAAKFLEGLRERGYYDLVAEYLAKLRADDTLPAETRRLLDLEEGKALIDAGQHATDAERAKELFDKARARLDDFIKANPDAAETSEAIVSLAQLLYERGRTAAIQADEAADKPEREVKINEARAAYASAREAYQKAFDRLDAAFKKFDKFIPENDPRFAEREKVHGALLNAELQRSVVDYDEAQTFPAGSPERNDRLGKALEAFEGIYKRHRTQMAGFAARMWQGKCYEERGELGAAKGVYDELMDHVDPRLRPLQKKVDYFRIIVMAKRKDHALAADECVRWLTAFPGDRRSYESLGVQMELAKSLLAQVPDLEDADKVKASQRAADALREVVKVYSPFKAEALATLKQLAPKAAVKAEDVARLSFTDAMGQADQAISLQQYDEAASIIKLALKKNDATRDLAKFNQARYTLAFCLYMGKRYFEAAVIAEHIARRYPSGEWSAKATEIAVASMIDAYNAYPRGDRTSDLARLLDLARYTVATWPDTEQGDAARMTIGQISLGSGKYEDAVAAFESVRPTSAKSADAKGYAGDARWKLGLVRRQAGKETEADEETAKAVALLQAAIKARRDAGATTADLGLAGNICDLAGIYLETGKGKEALALVEPLARDLSSANRPAGLNGVYGRAMAALLRSHVAVGQVDAAINDMNALEKSGGDVSDRAQLYFELGRLLEREMEGLRKRNASAALKNTQAAYQKFLAALVNSKSGQTFESLSWAGTNLLKLGAAKEAEDVFRRVLDTYGKDTKFTSQLGSFDRLMLVRLRLVAALRTGGKFEEAESTLAEISAQFPRLLDPKMEKGHLISAKAAAKKATWAEAFNYWQDLALRLRAANPKPAQYFEAWYNAASALEAQGKPAQAKQTLAGVMRLSPTVGTPEMKTKYQEMIARLK